MLIKKIVGIVLIISVRSLFAASFDCAKAENEIEKMICSNKNLSELDNKMSSQFKNALAEAKHASLLIKEQRQWIAERNKCTGTSCLEESYSHRIAQLSSNISKKYAECPITEKNLIGIWTNRGSGDFEEMAFDVYENKRTFMSWLHHHPEMSGTWTLQGCELHIAHISDPKIIFDYKIKKYSRETLYLQESDSNTVSTYEKAK